MEKHERAGEFFRSVLTDVLDDLLDQVPSYQVPRYLSAEFKSDEVKQSLRSISQVYKKGLSSPYIRSDWDDAANRCAYVFLYLMHHCNIVFSSLQSNLSEISADWRYKYNLKVCSIGGGPGSDLLGLTTFLRLNQMFPSALRCLVLDLYPNWKETWDRIHTCIPGDFKVAYQKCDVVRDTTVSTEVRDFIREADMLTLVKSFSAMSAFFRASYQSGGDFLRKILRELKPGCFVLYIDNNNDGDNQFRREFALRVGLEVVYESRGIKTVPSGAYSPTIRKYCRLLDFSPMRSCDVNIQLFRKKYPAIPSLNINYEFYSYSPHSFNNPPLIFSSAKRSAKFPQRTLARFPETTILHHQRRKAMTHPRVAPEPSRDPRGPSPFEVVLIVGVLAALFIGSLIRNYLK
ncbi:uncharacterized protein LOC119733755 [Patiria miniata]|uniref:Uncharacterized protein n=1 Tax=Patiria miniata TaxID=46514 RepID=A0A914AH82_PATMI|nr:uncharacterized protein LOC119733755 [Patiria miniata]